MASLLVLVAHSGRTLQLDVQPSTRVDAVQHALVSFTGIPVSDQIAMYQGARLDPSKFLGAYRLPVDPALASVEDHPVFLYCRSYLKPGAALPPPEALPPLHVQVPPLADVNLTHPLHSAPSPLVRALPDYERHFQHHLATTRAYWDVAQARLQRCRQLLSEQEVQARAADAARANVEAHYSYILNSYQNFLDKYNAQHAAHAQLLSAFPADLAALEGIELHTSLRQPPPSHPPPHPQPTQPPVNDSPSQGPGSAVAAAAGSAGGVAGAAASAVAGAGADAAFPRRLADLYPLQRLREWAETCGRSHASFRSKVADLEALFQLLRRDVEGLFMQAPSVDLDALGRQMAEHEALLDEHSSMVQVLSKDLRTVRALVEDVVRQLGSAAVGGGAGGGGGMRPGALHDSAAAMEAIHETHRNRVLPRLAQLDGQLASFAAAVEASKVAMSRDVLSQLQRISGQQSRIRDMRNKLAAFLEVLSRQDAAFAELRVVHRLPSAYRAVLAEVVRRKAWYQLYCGQAGRLAEHMCRFREKEAGRRAVFAGQVARYVPADLLARAGLASEPPHCHVTVPQPAVPLIEVSMADLLPLSYLDERILAASSTAAAMRASAAAIAGRGAPFQPPTQPPPSQHSHPSPPPPRHHTQRPHAAAGAGTSSGGSEAPEVLGSGLSGSPSTHHHHGPHHQHHPHAQQQQHAQSHHPPYHRPVGGGVAIGGPRGLGAAASQSLPFPGTVAVLDADPAPQTDAIAALEMENARLRAELANHIAAACVRELTAAAADAAGGGGGSGDGSQQQGSRASSAQLQQQPYDAGRTSGGGSAGTAAVVVGSPSAVHQQLPQQQQSQQQAGRRDPAELVAAMQRALSMKDDLIHQQQREAAALAVRVAAYEQRIAGLEDLLAARSRTAEEEEGSGAATVARAARRAAGWQDGSEGVEEDSHAGVQTCGAGSGRGVAEPNSLAAAAAEVDGSPVAQEAGPFAGARGMASAAVGVGTDDGIAEDGSGGNCSAIGGDGVLSQRGTLGSSAGPPASPFSLQAAQEQSKTAGEEPSQQRPDSSGSGGGGDRDREGDGNTAAAITGTVNHDCGMAGAGATTSAAAAIPIQLQPAIAVPLRGSSGPQAIPQAGGGRIRRGGAATPAGVLDGTGVAGGRGGGAGAAEGLPFEAPVPMSIGSLPFATSLPVASSLASRLAASPSAGIGLGMALDFGLMAVGKGPQPGPQHSGQGSGSPPHRRRRSSSSSDGASSASGSDDGRSIDGGGHGDGGCVGRERSEGDERGASGHGGSASFTGSREAGSISVGGGGGGVSGGCSSGGASSLQFQPSWSAPVSGELAATGADGDGEDYAEARDVSDVVAAGAVVSVAAHGIGGVDRDSSADGGPDRDSSADGAMAIAAEASAAGAEGGSCAFHGSEADGLRGEEGEKEVLPRGDGDGGDVVRGGEGGDASVGDGEEVRDGAAEEELGNGGGDDDDEGAADLPDIDDVIDDSDGAWELTSATAAAGAGMGTRAGGISPGVLSGAEDNVGGGGVGASLAACSAEPIRLIEQGEAGSEGRARVRVGGAALLSGFGAFDAGGGCQQLGQQQQLVESSSGYESVGSLLSGAGDGV